MEALLFSSSPSKPFVQMFAGHFVPQHLAGKCAILQRTVPMPEKLPVIGGFV